ncbi:MAG: hypothetical protein CMP21_08845 [Rickettsiales bacterium]|nr:hypothetical protein [Rickettsiales bacterium]|tara:strand:- start:99 stop:284 length:186 start_codon:yes stop_codon:yes gene_type:complete
MKEFIEKLSEQPEIGIVSSVGSGTLYWTGILNPILSFLTLLVGLIIGIITLAIKITEWRRL